MIKNVLILIYITFMSYCTYSQDNTGYYGKRTFIEASITAHSPLFYQLLFSNIEGYELSFSGNSLQEKRNWFHVGYRASFGRAMKSNMGLAVELGYDKIVLNQRLLLSGDYENPYLKHESFEVNSLLVMPRIEISGRNGLLPNGVVHQIGVGVTINSIVRKNYLVDHGSYKTGGPNGDPEDEELLFTNHKLEGNVKLCQLMYALKIRKPLTKFLMLNYGFRYTIDFGLKPSGFSERAAGGIIDYQLYNFIAFDLGLTLPL